MASKVLQGIWRVADPKITLASAASIALGSACAAASGPLAVSWLLITVVGIFAIEAAKNASGEIFDFDSGTDSAVREEDRSPFSGGKRVLVDGWLTRAQTKVVAGVAYGTGVAAGLWIVVAREPAVLGFGVAGVALAYFYHAPPLRLSYRGFGEIAVATTYGPLIACGAYVVQRGDVSFDVLYLSLPLGLMIGAFLLINEFPDHDADASAGKRTLVVRLGKRRATALFAVVVGVASTLVLLAPLWGLPRTVWIASLGTIPAARAAARLARTVVTAEIVPAQRWTLMSFLLVSVGASVAMLVG